ARALSVLVARPSCLLRYSRRAAAESAALDRGLRSRRHHPLHGRKSVPGIMEPRSDRVVDRQVLRPGSLGLLLARRALPVRDAAAGAPPPADLRHAAADDGLRAY